MHKVKEIQQEVSCNLCGETTYSVVYPARFSPEDSAHTVLARFRQCGGDLLLDRVVRCKRCGLVYINPRLRDDLLLQEYTDASIQGYKEQFVAQHRGRERAFTRCLQQINKYVPSRGKLLDVGAAAGTFMAVARRDGWEVSGCEPNTWFCQWGKEHYGITIDQGTLFNQKYPENFFDVITLWDVIEHVTDPLSLVAACARLLKPNGLFVCTYPDIGSWIARLMQRRWVFLMSVHLYYFTKTTIRSLLQRCGFKVERIFPHIQILQAGYILYRMQTHSAFLYRICKAVLDITRMHDRMLPYWVGINCVIARKE
ncbi:MAG: class I SAM-dependent methyltransferase [Desulfobacterota bacterium]|nr:class I SAM-dependent methyltransferase [Thermodesulfobacteriota bacterium]